MVMVSRGREWRGEGKGGMWHGNIMGIQPLCDLDLPTSYPGLDGHLPGKVFQQE